MRIAFCLYSVPESVQLREFYLVDIEALRSLGHEVTVLHSPLRLAAGRFDVAFVWWWNYLTLWGPAALARGIPIVATGVYDGGDFDGWPAWKRMVKRAGTPFPRLNVFVGRREIDAATRKARFRRGSVRYSPLGVDTTLHAPGPARDPGGTFTVFNIASQSVGNLRRKMVFELVGAFARLHHEHPHTRLVLAGARGDATEALHDAARRSGAGQAIELLGQVERDEKIRRMQACSLYVQVSRTEGFGLAVAEAMACGAPVLVSDAGELPEVVGDCGVYVGDISGDGILERLRWCVDHRADLAELGARARARIEATYPLSRRRAELDALLREVTAA